MYRYIPTKEEWWNVKLRADIRPIHTLHHFLFLNDDTRTSDSDCYPPRPLLTLTFSFLPPFKSICERVTPRLSHANSAVVLSAVKVLMKFLELLPKDSDYYNTLLKKLSPPLVTLLSGEPEVQYVALRNINLIVQKRCVVTNRRSWVVFSAAVDSMLLLLPMIYCVAILKIH